MLGDDENQVEYPFSKTRVYLYLFGGLLTVIFSIPILLEMYSDPLIYLSVFFGSTAVVILASLKFKLYIIRKMQEMEEDKIVRLNQGHSIDRRFFVIVFFIVVALLLPVVVFSILEIHAWFIGLACFVAGFCLSEPLLYKYSAKKFDNSN
ncbi:MAG: hypothetical protein JSV05_07350 [Candidatus Bathyarchaeota archaeon]|nr:MAG: hypothetical protein JSV05_07350 [Candidatus Bathyarchaeota archaeon]